MDTTIIQIKNINEIGEHIKKKRKTMKLTQKDLASLCGVGTRFISELENGKNTLEIGKVLKVIKNLGFDYCLKERTVIR